ncbi:Hsp70 family protein [Actinosynnema sp. NPDC053489]|uniref:Hsp70 family protein n=1 Tax=Actinosynnema sp. NPDC053489 TaxID=3363916 RepID=UPI0037C7A876
MHYAIGVDLGTSFTAAAVSGPTGTRMVHLGPEVVTPSAVFVTPSGGTLSGDTAVVAGRTEPTRLSRGFKRRLGDPTPLVIGGAAFSATALLAAQLRDVLAAVRAAEGAPPNQVVLTCPAVWGPYRREHFAEVPVLAGVRDARVVTEPEAAAMHYAVERRLGDGELIAVYDLGGGTFDTTVLRARPGGMEILGTPEGVERLGGMDFDDALLSEVDARLDGAVGALDPADPRDSAALGEIRALCVRAKEELSTEPSVTIRVPLPGGVREVEVTRLEFNDMIRPAVALTTEAMQRTIASAGLRPQDLSAVLLAGGSSRIPLVPQMVSAAFGRPVRVGLHPKLTVALGAAAMAGEAVTAPRPAAPRPAPAPHPVPALPVAPARRRPRWLVPAAAAAVAVAAAATAVALVPNDNGTTSAAGAPASTTDAAAAPGTRRMAGTETRIFDGRDVPPFTSVISSDQDWSGTRIGPGRTASHPAVSVVPGDLGGEQGLAVKWSGAGAGQLSFQDPDNKLDLTAVVEARGAVVFDVVVRVAPAAAVTVGAHCTYPCAGEVDATRVLRALPVGRRSTVRIPLACFVDAGLDPTKVDTLLLLRTEGRFEADFGMIRWIPREADSPQATRCDDLQ